MLLATYERLAVAQQNSITESSSFVRGTLGMEYEYMPGDTKCQQRSFATCLHNE
jgi:hypothetical protein